MAESTTTQKEKVQFICPVCDKPYPTKIYLKMHYQSVHGDIEEFDERYPMPPSKKRKGKNTQEMIINFPPPIEKITVRYVCPLCPDKHYSSKLYVKLHYQKEHNGEVEELDDIDLKTRLKTFDCPKCSYTVFDLDKYNIHVQKHKLVPNALFICEFCNLKFENKDDILNHNLTQGHIPLEKGVISVLNSVESIKALNKSNTPNPVETNSDSGIININNSSSSSDSYAFQVKSGPYLIKRSNIKLKPGTYLVKSPDQIKTGPYLIKNTNNNGKPIMKPRLIKNKFTIGPKLNTNTSSSVKSTPNRQHTLSYVNGKVVRSKGQVPMVNNTTVQSNKVIKCIRCDIIFDTEYELKCHINKRHEGEVVLSSIEDNNVKYDTDYKCGKCSKDFINAQFLMVHWKVCEGDLPNSNKNIPTSVKSKQDKPLTTIAFEDLIPHSKKRVQVNKESKCIPPKKVTYRSTCTATTSKDLDMPVL